MRSNLRLAILVGTALVLGGCFERELEFSGSGGGANPPAPPPPSASNRAPTISGTPPADVLEGEPYEFVPSAADADGDALEFSIARKPSWATFDRSTGRLAGTPGAGDVGNFTNIEITVSDGQASAGLTAFDITVNQIAFGTATLSWNPPTENIDGSALQDLSGYRIYYGRNRDNLAQVVVLNNPGLTRYVVENLTAARWFFAMTSVNSAGAESPRTSPVSKVIG